MVAGNSVTPMEAITQIRRVKERTDEFSENTFLLAHFQVMMLENEDGAREVVDRPSLVNYLTTALHLRSTHFYASETLSFSLLYPF